MADSPLRLILADLYIGMASLEEAHERILEWIENELSILKGSTAYGFDNGWQEALAEAHNRLCSS